MMDLDLIYVTYNSSKWIDNCFNSLFKCDYDLRKIHVYVVDNNSNDDTLLKLEKIKKLSKDFLGGFSIIKNETNSGFGVANNIGAQYGSSTIILFLNIDTELFVDSLNQLVNYISMDEHSVAVWEMRQFPNELPKYYDPLTLITNWSSGAAFAIKRDIFEEVGGFDSNIFMYAEDVDLSWKIQEIGYKIKYCVNSKIYHYTNEKQGVIKPNAYLNCFKYNLLLRYRYGNIRDILYGHCKIIFEIFVKKSKFSNSKFELLKKYLEHFSLIQNFIRHSSKEKFAIFNKLGYGYEKDSGGYLLSYTEQKTHLNVFVLDKCYGDDLLYSIKNQTYQNFSVYEFTFDSFRTNNILTFNDVIKLSKNGDPFLLIIDNVILYPDHFESLIQEYTIKQNFVRSLYCVYPLITLDPNYSLVSNILFTNSIFNSHSYKSVDEVREDIKCYFENVPINIVNKATILYRN